VSSPDTPRTTSSGASVQRSGEQTHVVQRGETLKSLARRYGVSIQALRKANGLSEHDLLRVGAALKIPG